MLDLSLVQNTYNNLENMAQEVNLRHDRMDDNILKTYVVQIIVFIAIFSSVISSSFILREEVLLGMATSCILLFIAIICLQRVSFMSDHIGLGSYPSFWLRKQYLGSKGENQNKHVLAKALLELIVKKQESIKNSTKSLERKKKKLKVAMFLTASSGLCYIIFLLISINV